MSTFIEANRSYEKFSGLEEKKKFHLDLSKLCNIKLLFLICFIIFALIVPFLIFFGLFDEGDFTKGDNNLCLVARTYRLPCGKQNISHTDCKKLFCCFETPTNSCYHSEPSNYYFHLDNSKTYIPSKKNTPLGYESLKKLNMNVITESDKVTIILNDTRQLKHNFKEKSSNFDIIMNENNKLSVTIFRKHTKELLLTTLKGPLIACTKYLEWTIQLTNASGVLFGLGELKIDLNENSTLTKVIYKNQNDHNILPVFMAYNNGKYHAVSIIHEGALEVTVLPSYLISLRAILGRKIEIQLIEGPTPQDIYGKLRGETSLLPEWAFGVHICREEPTDTLTSLLDQYREFVKNRPKYPKFTIESDCIHDDILLHIIANNYTSSDIAKIIVDLNLKENLMLSFPTQIPVYSGLFNKWKDNSIFMKNDTTGNIYVGRYKGFDVVYPIYKHTGINDFLADIKELFEQVKIMGLTFTNSWPHDESYVAGNSTVSFINQKVYDTFSYTIPWNLSDDNDVHIRYHNDYGPTMESTVANLFTSSEFSFNSVSDMKTFKPLLIQYMNTSWTAMKQSVTRSLSNSIFGHNLISTPICGSTNFYDKKVNEELCLRWYIVAASMPMVRISSKGTPRDPTNLNSKYTNDKAIDVLVKRKSLVPLYRTISYYSGPIIRPMFYNFPYDENVHGLSDQYMIGDGILVAQPMSPDIEILNIYLPHGLVWYEFWGGLKYQTKKNSELIKFPIFKIDWISFILEGSIIPRVTQSDSGDDEMHLIVAMNCTDTCHATGSLLLYFANEQSDVPVTFSALEDEVNVIADKNVDVIKQMIKSICFYGYTKSECIQSDIQKYIV